MIFRRQLHSFSIFYICFCFPCIFHSGPSRIFKRGSNIFEMILTYFSSYFQVQIPPRPGQFSILKWMSAWGLGMWIFWKYLENVSFGFFESGQLLLFALIYDLIFLMTRRELQSNPTKILSMSTLHLANVKILFLTAKTIFDLAPPFLFSCLYFVLGKCQVCETLQ